MQMTTKELAKQCELLSAKLRSAPVYPEVIPGLAVVAEFFNPNRRTTEDDQRLFGFFKTELRKAGEMVPSNGEFHKMLTDITTELHRVAAGAHPVSNAERAHAAQVCEMLASAIAASYRAFHGIYA